LIYYKDKDDTIKDITKDTQTKTENMKTSMSKKTMITADKRN